MKHWEYGRTDNHNYGIYMNKTEDSERVISIDVDTDTGIVTFCEECDGWFSVEMAKGEAIEALQEAIDWIKGQEE